ncbi:MAG: DEAD/DEAH box helicase family protein, partial [Blastochloris sp.]|nr:DEAD/DEAH box helicase family protein [Blastochloris sp.]
MVLRFPRGAARKLDHEAQQLGIDLDFEDERLTLDDYEFAVRPSAKPVTLRPDQEATIDAILTRENGLVRAATGCLAGDTIIGVHRGGKGFKLRIDQLVHRFNGGRIQGRKGATWDPETPTMVRSEVGGFVRLHRLRGAVVSGVREVYEVKTAGGRSLKATLDHRFKTPAGWRRLGELSMGDRLLVNIGRPKAGTPKGLVFLDPKEFHVHHQDEDPLNNNPENLMIMKAGDHHRQHGKEGGWKHVTERVGEDLIVEIRRLGFEKTYDLEMDGEPRNFLANGIVVHNSGKTEIVIEAIRRARQPALVVVWSKALLDQWVERISLRWGWPTAEIGVVGDGRFRVGPITVAMHQSLAPRVDALRSVFGFVACDEVHRWAARTFRDIAGLFPARFRIGVSADERRKDGLEDLTRDIFGPVAYELNRKDLIREGRIAEVKIVAVPTGFQIGGELAASLASMPESERGSVLSQNYVKVLDQLVADPHRNDTIGRLASQAANEGRSVLVFTDRVEHAYEIARVVSTRYGVPCGTLVGGAGNRAAFVETAARLHDGTLRVAVGTSCVYEGFDVPRLEVGIVA